MQAASLDADNLKKVSLLLGGIFGAGVGEAGKAGPKPRTKKEEDEVLSNMGFKKRRA